MSTVRDNDYVVDFGFQVSDRLVLATVQKDNPGDTQIILDLVPGTTANDIRVRTEGPAGTGNSEDFYIMVV